MAGRIRPRREDVRADIMAHATEAFERDGYVGASLASIAADAGYTKGAIYSGFGGGKPELFAEVCVARLERVGTEMMASLQPVLTSDADRDDLAARLASALTAFTLDAPARWQLLQNEFRAVALRDPKVDAVYRDFAARRVEFLVDLFAANDYLGRLARPTLTRAAVMLLALVNALALEHTLAPDTVDRATVEQSVRAMLASVLPS